MKNKLLQIIAQAAHKGQTVLDLSKMDLRRLPPEIGRLTNLKKLSLDGNELRALPPQIGQLTNLNVLLLNDNQLSALPSEMGRLSHLNMLALVNNRLTTLPPEIGQLANLSVLALANNQLTTLPPEIGRLTRLRVLSLGNNRLSSLPPEIGQLTNLRRLRLHNNELTTLPPEIGRLTALTKLPLDGNLLATLPPEIGQLANLPELGLANNQLTMLPGEIGRLTSLTELWLSNNRLTELPTEIGRLTKLDILAIDDNPLVFPPPGIVHQGRVAVLAYLQEHLQASRDQWVSKLLVVGEGGVGKTSLLQSLVGKGFDPLISSTHGIEITTLKLLHRTIEGVTMKLNAWDFGGQDIYHATHQFFLTNRSLFLLVWNARHGYEQGKLYYWLDTIQAKAPESPILLVATNIDERDAELPLKDLRNKYPQIISRFEISNRTGEGIEVLRGGIADSAAELPLMGETWPAAWLDATEAIRAMVEKHISAQRLWDMMRSHQVTGENAKVLAQWLHELGDILFFQDVKELEDIVILKPQWVSKYISKVLESDDVIKRLGILTRAHRDALWHDIEPAMRDHFLRLMERFDLSHRALEDRELYMVVERLPLDPPDYEETWAHILRAGPCKEISMKFALNTMQAGIPTWFIARSHRFTTHTHWRTGALFADSPEKTHLALVEAFPHERYLQLTVRGPRPQNFFALLRDGLDLTLNRFPGLKVERLIPCPGHEGESCSHEFKYGQLLNRLERKPPGFRIECPESSDYIDVPLLLFGLVPGTFDDVHMKIGKTIRENRESVQELIALLQREFLKRHQKQQSKRESHCPNVFAMRQVETREGKRNIMQLYCQAPGCWHFVGKGGRYVMDQSAKLLRKIAPLLKGMIPLLHYLSSSIGPWTNMGQGEYGKMVQYDVTFNSRLLEILYDIEGPHDSDLSEGFDEAVDGEWADMAALVALRQFLDEKDPEQCWGGLRKVQTPEGHYLWLCKYHAGEYAQ
ncbi:MAG: GTPase [Deltaproteobacteria bacterium]|nr:GTPase [Deltaproteobacteria bacterium]